jgi:hypothetical protein
MTATHCFAVPGQDSIVDMIRPSNGLSFIGGDNLEQIQARYPGAIVMSWEDFRAGMAQRQNTPVAWEETTEERYHEMLNVLPPEMHRNGAFLVGEASDHSASTGRARYAAFKHRGAKYYAATRPLTRVEFQQECPL